MKRGFENSGPAMTDAVDISKEDPKKSGKKSLILALVLALVGGGGGFYSVSAGLVPFGKGAPQDPDMNDAGGENGKNAMPGMDQAGKETPEMNQMSMKDITFIEIDPITISLNSSQAARHLRFKAQLEVYADYEREVSAALPRVTDVLNSYLRAVELEDLTGPMALVKLRAQMLRRVQVVAGRDRVRDLLIMEFVLN